MTYKAIFGAGALLLTVGAGEAFAQSLTGNVGSANITKGDRSVETRVGVNDDGDAAARVHYDYAPTGWYQLRTIAAFRKPDDADWTYSGVTFDNWFQWAEEAGDKSGFNGGVRLAYTFKDGGGPDEAAVRLTLTDKFADAWEWRANVIAEFETGKGSEGGAALETRAQITRGFGGSPLGAADWRAGVEWFSEYGDTRDLLPFEEQLHQAGPVVKMKWDNGVYLQSAVRFALTDPTDDMMVKLFIGRDF